MRYRLVPSRGGVSRFVEGLENARAEGEAAYAASERTETVAGKETLVGDPVLLCEAPEGGLVTQVEMIGASKVRRR